MTVDKQLEDIKVELAIPFVYLRDPHTSPYSGTQAYQSLMKVFELIDKLDKPSILIEGVRPAIQWFAEQMEATLQRNDHKGGWCNHDGLLDRLREETDELHGALVRHNASVIAPNTHPNDVVREAVDVANFAMMIADEYGPKYGHLKWNLFKLSEWDAADLLPHERATITYLLKDLPSAKGPFEENFHSSSTVGLRFQDGVVRDTYVNIWTGHKLNILTYPVFLRRLCNTFGLTYSL